jgi:hypothetical protein
MTGTPGACMVGVNTADCQAPIGSGLTVSTHCYSCGLRACDACSSWVLPERRRVGQRRFRQCNDCRESNLCQGTLT